MKIQNGQVIGHQVHDRYKTPDKNARRNFKEEVQNSSEVVESPLNLVMFD